MADVKLLLPTYSTKPCVSFESKSPSSYGVMVTEFPNNIFEEERNVILMTKLRALVLSYSWR